MMIKIVKQIAWISFFAQFFVAGVIILFWYQINTGNFLIHSLITILAVTFIPRILIARYHRNGMVAVKSQNYKDAILHFEKSYAFFKKYSWIDKYRYAILTSSSKMGYKEMALNNIAFCYLKTGNLVMARRCYEKTIERFSKNKMAKAALKMLKSSKLK